MRSHRRGYRRYPKGRAPQTVRRWVCPLLLIRAREGWLARTQLVELLLYVKVALVVATDAFLDLPALAE
jgi:hypothetical protein